MFSPPEMMMSLERSLISMYPSSCHTPRSPVWYQPSRNASRAMLEAALDALRRIREHVEHDRRAAKVRDAVPRDRREDQRGIDLAQAHVRRSGGRDRPGVGPPAAMEHRQRPQVHRAWREAERE